MTLKEDPALFYSVEVDQGGYGIIWNDDIDIACDELYYNGKTVSTPFDGLISFGDATLLWGLNESTLRKAISYGKLKTGIDVCKFGKQWIISSESMIREYGLPRIKPLIPSRLTSSNARWKSLVFFQNEAEAYVLVFS